MSCICQTQVNITESKSRITETNVESQNSPFKSGMRLDTVVWLRDMDTNGGIYRETWHLCKDMQPDYAVIKQTLSQNLKESNEFINYWKIHLTCKIEWFDNDHDHNNDLTIDQSSYQSIRFDIDIIYIFLILLNDQITNIKTQKNFFLNLNLIFV